MELILYGNANPPKDWYVEEQSIPGYVRVYLIHSGIITYEDPTHKEILQTNTIYLFPSHTTYCMHSDESVEFTCTWIHLNLYPIIITKLITITSIDCPMIHKTFSLIEEIVKDDMPSHHPLQICIQLFLHYCNQYHYLPNPSPFASNLLGILSKDMKEKIVISKVAKQLGYSKEHYIRLFKTQVGISPYQFLISCRMTKSCELLHQEYTITEISELIGYQDIKTFERAFKKYYGRTPSDYQKNYLDLI